MKTHTIEPAALASLASVGGEFNVSARPTGNGWIIYVHDRQGARVLIDLNGHVAAVFDALQTVEERLRALGIDHFLVEGGSEGQAYEQWLQGAVQQALDDPASPTRHEEAMRQIRAAIRTK